MKRFILFTFSILLTFTFAIAQDGINYQGAATDANGDELTNQNISIRASVLSTTANGNLEWEETHSATTDQFGLFNVVIGQGTNTTNGATASFDDMDWGSGNHFLKIEMDASGGTNYAIIGTTQMMSVPYALYAKSAGIDSTMLANMIGSSVGGMGGGCDLKFPEGLDGEIITIQQTNNYQIPSGKRLYITHISGWLSIDGISIYGDNNNPNGFRIISSPIIVDENQVLSNPMNGGYFIFSGILINTNQNLLPITIESNNYLVPASKKLIVNYVRRGSGSFNYGNASLELVQELLMPIIINQGTLIQSNNSSFNGYLVDENYFANCGGGGGSSSSASAVDSAMVANMIGASGSSSSNTYGGIMPSWVYNTGICSDNIPELLQTSNNMISIGNMNLNGDHSFCNFTLNAGHTLTIDGDFLILRVADTLTIKGTIDGVGKVSTTTSDGGVSGGGSSSCSGSLYAYSGNANQGGISNSILNGIDISTNGSSVNPEHYFSPIISNNSKLKGAQGAYGCTSPGVGPANGGKGGAGLVIICKFLKFDGQINLSGQNGADASGHYDGYNVDQATFIGGSGGGGGGSIIINTEHVISGLGSIITSGGVGGGSGSMNVMNYGMNSGSAGNGGDGFILWIGDQ